jgi:uncharacterized membrane protein
MKNCPNCNTELPDDAVFCTSCGTSMNGPANAQPNGNQNFQQNYQYQPIVQPWDHTAEFSAKDVSDNKVLAMLLYLMGGIAILYALIGGQKSDYLAFHVRQCLKFMVCEILLILIAALLCITIIVPIAAGICLIILTVVKIICFFQICGNKSVEPAIIRSLGFLK